MLHVWRSEDNLGSWSLPPNLLTPARVCKFSGAPSRSISHIPAGGLELHIHVLQFLWFLQEVQRSELRSSVECLYPSPICLKSFPFPLWGPFVWTLAVYSDPFSTYGQENGHNHPLSDLSGEHQSHHQTSIKKCVFLSFFLLKVFF